MEKARIYLAEFIGTLMLVAIGTGVVVFVGTQAGPLPVALAFGLGAMAAIYAIGGVSGGHLNPAVSLAMAINNRLGWLDFLGYVVAQVLGAVAGSAVVAGFFAAFGAKKEAIQQIGFGQTTFQQPVSFLGATLIEFLLTFMLVLVVMMVTSKKYAAGNLTPIVVGFTLVALILLGISATGASLNPARSFGPALMMLIYGSSTAMSQIGVYLLGPLAGAALAALVAKFLGSEEA
ncbi:aquaporin Z [Weissella uvarum]|uniref:MIP/aquaporin family protein n=1 Tax=Weissella uvarum TaxID=1479233 RepID=UPI001960F072|nr:aquaporin [Weissella uvarum]MBM7616899.1 aquaporin Z [Weissella uvarum]MCM0594649.1 aquaporin [Weissella uvarum]